MTRIRLKYVHAYCDRYGAPRYYFRKAGFKKIPLPDLPGSEAFMRAYEAALENAPRIVLGADRSKPGSVSAAIAGYFGSAAFAQLAKSSKRPKRRILERFREQHGDKRIATLEHRHIAAMLGAKAQTPGEARNFLAAMRALMRFAVSAGLRADNPTAGLANPKLRPGGHYTWTEQDISRFRGSAPHRYQGAARACAPALFRPAAFRCPPARPPTYS